MRFATILSALVLCLVNVGPTVSRAVVRRNADKEGDDSYPNPDWANVKRAPAVEARLNEEEEYGVLAGAKRASIS
ncbi:hypothetical protein DFH06DRAFT_1392007 [Mycena polygramma]|nr:hypothetical protein DFH06DRAFT_1392007 [Mycena polygramma]